MAGVNLSCMLNYVLGDWILVSHTHKHMDIRLLIESENIPYGSFYKNCHMYLLQCKLKYIFLTISLSRS